MAQNTYNPETVTHPGLILEEALEEKGIGSKEFAVRTGKPEKTISNILKEKSGITSDMAIQFEQVLKIPARFWLESQRRYDECVARKKYQEEIGTEEALTWARSFPYNDMAKKGWVKDTRKQKERISELLSYFGLASPSAWKSYYFEKKLKVAFRASLKSNEHAPGLTAWLRHGQIYAREALDSTPTYSKARFKGALEQIKELVVDQPSNFFETLEAICSKVGVIIIHTPALPNVAIHGATRWYDDTPVIQLTGRYKRNDIFWFTFFHEAGHILKHGKKYISLENVEYDGMNEKFEKEADEFAAEQLFSKKAEKELLAQENFTEELIERYAKEHHTHPAIIVGRLQHKKIIPFNEMRKYFKSIAL